MIVGAGWMFSFGLFSHKKGHDVKLFEKNKIFNGMSGANTNRLYMAIIIQEVIKQEFNRKLVIINLGRSIQI